MESVNNRCDNPEINKSSTTGNFDCYIVNTPSRPGTVRPSSCEETGTSTDSYKLCQPMFEIRKDLSSEPTDSGSKPFLCFRHPPRHRR